MAITNRDIESGVFVEHALPDRYIIAADYRHLSAEVLANGADRFDT